MSTEDSQCERLRSLLTRLLTDAFGLRLNEILTKRGQELWILGIDSKQRKLVDICGNIDADILKAINAKGFLDTDAGFKADAQNVLPLSGKKADIFLLNMDHINSADRTLVPLVIHELCHYVEQTGTASNIPFSVNDVENARTIMRALAPNVAKIHTEQWARLLAWSARHLVENKLCFQTSVAYFVDLAIPDYDKPNWNRKLIKE